MSIIEKALDKALGRSEGEVPAAEKRVKEVFEEPVIEPEPPTPVDEPTVKVFEDQPVEIETEEEADHGPLHAVDVQALQRHGFLTDASVDSPMLETYRGIARPVLFNAFPDGAFRLQRANLVLITSSRGGEGKTFTAVNLAMTIAAAQTGRPVLLIDADTEKASASKLFGLAGRIGLTDLLENKGQKLQETIIRTDLPNLRILPAGSITPKSPGLLADASMEKLAKELSARYPDQLAIFDAPALLEMEDVAGLATQLGQVIVVVESEMTPQVVVHEAVARLEFCNVVGCVLNKVAEHAPSPDFSFGYGMYYPNDTAS